MECKARINALGSGYHPRINRNIVECKESQQKSIDKCCLSINRNIVECKDTVDDAIIDLRFSINRNIVECKAN